MKKNSRIIFYIASAGLLVVSFAGMIYYGYKTFYIQTNAAVQQDYAYHFALIAEESGNDYWRLIEDGAKKAAKENQVYLEYVAPEKADNEEMLKLLDQMIAAKVDGIIIQGIEGEKFKNLVHKANEQNIPVVTVDTDVKDSERRAYVGTNNYYAGTLLAEALLQYTKGEQYVGIVTGRFDAINQRERIQGFKHSISKADRIHLVDVKESSITEIGATRAAYALLKENPQITALIGTSALDGVGMVNGLREIVPFKDVYTLSFDILDETLELMKADKIDATITQYPKEMGNQSVHVMIELQKHALTDRQVFTGTKILTKQAVKNRRTGHMP